MLIGMMCFAGLRAEIPDLEENSNNTIEMTSIHEVNIDIVSNVSTVQDVNLEVNLSQFNLAQNVMMVKPPDTKVKSHYSNGIQINANKHAFKQDRNPRDGIRHEYRK